MKIAVVGSGISGLSAAYILSQKHDVTLFEKENYFGGHSNTVSINHHGQDLDVDTGFIVFNKKTYPNLVKFFEYLQVPYHESDMSFGITVDNGKFEYSGRNLAGVFAQAKNALNPKYLKMLYDLFKFNRISRRTDLANMSLSLEEYLNKVGVGAYFRNYYLYPMVSAIWSTPQDKMTQYPAATFLKFFRNHGLLQVINQPQWYTVTGGSKVYVKKITDHLKKVCHKSNKVTQVKKKGTKLILETDQKETHTFDKIVLACHADESAEILKDFPQSKTLAQIKYEPNDAYLHKDTNLMPKSKKAWASWVYLYKSDKKTKTSLSYWMNSLQLPQVKEPVLVTLNPENPPAKKDTYYYKSYMHPVYDATALTAQEDIASQQGKDGIWLCGAYMGYGFHEDGLKSALDVCEGLGVAPPWQ